MSHPVMFDDDDPVLARVKGIALALPGADWKVSHGRPAFFTRKVFAYYGGSEKVDGEWIRHEQCVMVLLDPSEREALLDEERVFVPAYLGPSGWVGVDLPEDVDWAEVTELIDASYRLTAGARLVAELDAATGS
ncbi:MmcQ/YjbR family DNA-binding protein [Nocardioides sp.]|uniref:MmcQ/YjbR family DNA-binding protein n=1 Tax=Nocardioides sp. TaxID=35761 RepID=UPI0035647C31